MGISTLNKRVCALSEISSASKSGGELGRGFDGTAIANISAIDRVSGSHGLLCARKSPRNIVGLQWESRRGFKHGAHELCGLRSNLGLSSGGRRLKGNRIWMRSGGDQNDSNISEDPVETLFMRELRRRGISSDTNEAGSATGTDTKTKPEETEEGTPRSSGRSWSQLGGSNTESPQWSKAQSDEQLKRSMLLNSEGLEGLIPRAQELLKLGASFWIVFWPFILSSVAAFIGLYLYFGSTFVHAGDSSFPGGRPPYVDPYQLLEEEVIPSEVGPNRVPFRNPSS